MKRDTGYVNDEKYSKNSPFEENVNNLKTVPEKVKTVGVQKTMEGPKTTNKPMKVRALKVSKCQTDSILLGPNAKDTSKAETAMSAKIPDRSETSREKFMDTKAPPAMKMSELKDKALALKNLCKDDIEKLNI